MTTTSFEIRKANAGYHVFAATSGDFGNGSGLASMETFPDEAGAVRWVAEQYAVPASAWARQANGDLATKKQDAS